VIRSRPVSHSGRHALPAGFEPQALGEPDGGVLGGAVGQQVRGGQLPADRGDGEDPAAGAGQQRQCRERRSHQPPEHDVHGLGEVLLAQNSSDRSVQQCPPRRIVNVLRGPRGDLIVGSVFLPHGEPV